jgi:hypothetical protein
MQHTAIERMPIMKTIQALKFAAMVPLAFMVLILLAFGVGEILGGDFSGIQHFVPVIFVGLVVWLCWKRPLWGGILLLAGAVLQAAMFWRLFIRAEAGEIIAPLVIMILPLAFSGLLLLLAHWLGRMHMATK